MNKMNMVMNVLKQMTKDETKVLGRWNIEYCYNKMNNKIDLSNEDHCGPCGQYRLDKVDTYTLKKQYAANIKDGEKDIE